MSSKVLSTEELAETIRMKILEKFPNEKHWIFIFRPCDDTCSTGIYVFSKWRKYHIIEIDDLGNKHIALETDDFNDLFYHILKLQFFHMYYRVPVEKIRCGPITGMFVNCWLARHIRCKKMEKAGTKKELYDQYLEWYSMFGDHFLHRWQNEVETQRTHGSNSLMFAKASYR